MFATFLLSGVLLTTMEAYSANEVIQGDVTTLYTPNVYAYEYFDLQVAQRDFIVFSVRACSDIHVALMHLWADTSLNITENVIGGWSNTKSVYRNGVVEDQRHYLDVDTPNIAHCTEFRTFWISWGSDRLRTGTGPIPGEQTFMELQRAADIAHHIQFVAFSTGFGVTGVWKIPENQGNYMDLFTPDDFRYQYAWKSTQHKNSQFRFYVLACSDVHVNLSPRDGEVYYEAVIGGWNNTMSVIRLANVHMQEYLETGLVHCFEWRQFWITWTEATIRVGKGTELFKNTFLEWNDPSFAGVNHLSFSCGYGSTGIWAFNEDRENAFKYYTTEETVTSHQEFRLFLSMVDRDNALFDVKACSDVWIAMSSYPGDVQEFAHQIYLGVENNTKSGVRLSISPDPIVEVQTIGILDCNYSFTFWISWTDTERRVGSGSIIGFNTFLTWFVEAASDPISTIGFSNAHQADSHYFLRRDAGDSLLVMTPSSYTYRSMWQSVVQDVMFTFRVRACQDIYVAMSGLLGVADKETYELIIGSCYVSFIRDASDVSNPIVEASTPDILSCTLFRSFWISWLGGFIRVGRGTIYGRNSFLQLPNVKPHPINAISVSTSHVEGLWEFETDTGDQVTIVTPNNNGNMKWLHLHTWVRWFHFYVQGSGARLVLSAAYRDSTNAYHIVIGSKRNTEYAIYRGNVLVKTYSESNVLSLSEFEEFWLSWEGGLIQLGRSRYRVIEPRIAYQDPQPMTVKAVAVHGGSESFGEWKFSTNIASELSLWTERYKSYESWLSVKHRTSMVFALHTCYHAEVLLSAVPFLSMEDDFVYTVVLQDKSNMTSIWRGNRYKKMAEHHTQNILSCHEEKHFWLSWYGGHICLGHGRKKGENMIVSYQDLNPSPIYAISFSSFEVAGGWRIPLHSDGFASLSSGDDVSSQSLSGGEIAGIVIGSLLMICLFLAMVFVILVGPENVTAKFRGITGSRGDPAASSKASVTTSGFDNPLSVTEFSEISIS